MVSRRKYEFVARDFSIALGERTRLMGILNLTPDSFSGDGQFGQGRGVGAAVRRAVSMVRAGADIVDVGGESTRPGASRIVWREEVRRVVPVIKALVPKIGVPVSVDTYKPEVAQAALDAGASIVNVIQGTPISPRLLKIISGYGAGVVLMHMRGTPRTMQAKTDYDDLLGEVVDALKKSVEKCIETGIKEGGIIVDPGIGFAKTVEQNLLLVQKLSVLGKLGVPVLVGPSRKSFIGKTLDLPVERRIFGTAAAVALSVMNGAHIVRVHDVQQMKEVVAMADAIVAAR